MIRELTSPLPRAITILATLIAAGVQPARAQTACTASSQYTLDFTTMAAAQLSYSGSYTQTVTNGEGDSMSVTLTFQTYNLSSSTVASTTMPQISNLVNDGSPAGGRNLVIGGILAGRTTSITANTRTIVTRFALSQPVQALSVQANDIDYNANQYRDWLHIAGANGSTGYAPAVATSFGTSNSGTKTNAGSTLQLGAATSPLTVGVSEAIGNADNDNNGDAGTLTASFAQPVDSITLRYGNSNQSTGGSTTGQQAYGIQRIRFCPLPAISVVKTSAPVATSGVAKFNVPGAEVDYIITVTNGSGGYADINSAVIGDVLPAGVTFYNGDINSAIAGTQNFVFTPGSSGVTLAAGNVSYSNNNGASYAYTPAAGYDAAVDAVRFVPQGRMAGNSSFTIRFRTRVN